MKIVLIITCIAMQTAWPAIPAWAGQNAHHNKDQLFAKSDITTHEPRIFVIEEGDIPKSAEKPERGWFSRNKWYILGGLVIVGGAAAAAAGQGSSSSGGDGSGSDLTVSW